MSGRERNVGVRASLMTLTFGFEQEDETSLVEPALLASLRNAAETLAQSDRDAWLVWVQELGACNATAVQRLIAHAFALTPEEFAESSLHFLFDDDRRYVLGSSWGDSTTTERLIAGASEHWSDEEVERFETAVKRFKPQVPAHITEPAGRHKWNKVGRMVRLGLLRALPKNRLTARGRRHIEQEERAFPHARLKSQIGTWGPILSIMKTEAMRRARDEDIINAFRTLPDRTGWDHPTRFGVGGNIELAREFAQFAKDSPERARSVLSALNADNGTRAAGYALDAMAENVEPGAVIALMHDVAERGFDGEEFRNSISRAIQRLIKREAQIDDETADIFERWVANPFAQERTREASQEATGETEIATGEEAVDVTRHSIFWSHGDLFEHPGGNYEVLEATVGIYLARREYGRLHTTLRAHLNRCLDAEVWAGILNRFPNLYASDDVRDVAFLQRLFDEVPRMVESKSAAVLMVNAYHWDEQFADVQLDRWRDAKYSHVRQCYGEIVALVTLIQPRLTWARKRLDLLIDDDALDEARAGAALSAAQGWLDTNARTGAWEILKQLLPKGEPGVWRATNTIFRMVDDLKPDHATVSLLRLLSEQPHFLLDENVSFIPERLATLVHEEPGLVGRVARRLIEAWRKKLAESRNHGGMMAEPVVDLAVTLHRLGAETRELGTELFEDLLAIDVYEAQRTRDEIDNRFREQGRTPRRRLPRRRRSRRRE